MRSVPRYTEDYRTDERTVIAKWLEAGESGTVVGLSGSGKSNFFRFLCHYPPVREMLQKAIGDSSVSLNLVEVNLNDLPANDLATFYRVLLKAFYESSDQFSSHLKEIMTKLYQENKRETDPFLPQSALHDLLRHFKRDRVRVVLVLDQFDIFYETAPDGLLRTLRGLRDRAKNNLSYIMGMKQPLATLVHSAKLGELQELLDGPICWIGAMSEPDAEQMIDEENPRKLKVEPKETDKFKELTGNYPSLLKVTCRWWRNLDKKPPLDKWETHLLQDTAMQNRLRELWHSFTQAEQAVLQRIQAMVPITDKGESESDWPIAQQLASLGFCRLDGEEWVITSDLLAYFIENMADGAHGKIWYDKLVDKYFRGSLELPLARMQRNAIDYFFTNAHYAIPKQDIILELWPDQTDEEEISKYDNRLHRLIADLRKLIEPNPRQPCYIVSAASGHYIFHPEGRAQ